jgi:hypothetical protein
VFGQGAWILQEGGRAEKRTIMVPMDINKKEKPKNNWLINYC